MENLDLTKLSPEQRAKIMDIVNNDKSSTIKEDFLKANESIRKSEEYEGMDYGTKNSFNEGFGGNITYGQMFGGQESISERRKSGKLTHADKVTYGQLEKIHEYGTPQAFKDKIRSIVEAKRNIDISEVSDVLDESTKKLLNSK